MAQLLAIDAESGKRCFREGLRGVWWSLLFAGLLFPFAALCSPTQVIVNADQASVPLDREMLRDIFSMRVRRWPSGEAVQVFILPDDNDLSDRFYREQLGIYGYVLRSVWDRMVFTGTGFAPIEVRSEAEMRERVRATPGAIGYVNGGKDRSV